MSRRPAAPDDDQRELARLRQEKAQLDDQVKLLVRLENRLHRSQLRHARELSRLEALNGFALQARTLSTAGAIIDQALDLLLTIFPFDQGAGWIHMEPRRHRLISLRAAPGLEVAATDPRIERDLSPLTRALASIVGPGGAAENTTLSAAFKAAYGPADDVRAAYLCLALPSLDDEIVGVLMLRRHLASNLPPHTPLPAEADMPFLRLVGSHAGAAVRGAQLTEALHAAIDEKRAFASTVVEAQEEERSRVARELHDAVGQDLIAMRMDADWIADHTDDIEPARALAARLAGRLEDTLGNLRRIIHDLRPPMLDDLGVASAVAAYGATISQRWGLCVETEIAPNLGDLGEELATALYRIAQESVNNAARHAEASTVQVILENIGGEVRLSISDDGRGIPPGRLDAPNSYGLVGMRERAEQLGGALQIHAKASGGTCVVATIPRNGKAAAPGATLD